MATMMLKQKKLFAGCKKKTLRNWKMHLQELEFGTGGLRGIMGVGTNRMNKYTIGKATQGYSNYLKQSFSKSALPSGTIPVTTAAILLKLWQTSLLPMA